MSNFFRERRRCPSTFKQHFLSDNNIPISWFGDLRQGSFGQDFSKLIFDDGEDGLGGSRGRHVDSIGLSCLF
jgi:hypothetical protein